MGKEGSPGPRGSPVLVPRGRVRVHCHGEGGPLSCGVGKCSTLGMAEGEILEVVGQ